MAHSSRNHSTTMEPDDDVVFVGQVRKRQPVDNDEVVVVTESPPPRRRRTVAPIPVHPVESIVIIDSPPPPVKRVPDVPPPPPPPPPVNRTPNIGSSSSKPPNFTCGICFDDYPHRDGLSFGDCEHIYCTTCLVTYLKGVANDKKYPVKCPGCDGELNVWRCANQLELHDKKASDDLQRLAVEKMTKGGVKYCSNKKCNTPFEYAGNGEQENGARVDCPLCSVATCVKCGLSWHEGKTCAQAEAGTELAQLAKENNWRHCPSCSELIERIDGCNFVRCKCNTGFCFACGKKYLSTKRGSGSNSHGTPGCNCGLFSRMNRLRDPPVPPALPAIHALPPLHAVPQRVQQIPFRGLHQPVPQYNPQVRRNLQRAQRIARVQRQQQLIQRSQNRLEQRRMDLRAASEQLRQVRVALNRAQAQMAERRRWMEEMDALR